MAIKDQSGDWARRFSPSLIQMESIALEAFANLPEEFRTLCGDMVIKMADFPDESVIEDLGLDSPFDILGLFEGNGLGERFTLKPTEGPNQLTLFRRAILDYWAENDEMLGDIITHVLINEIGNHFGLSDDDMDSLENLTN